MGNEHEVEGKVGDLILLVAGLNGRGYYFSAEGGNCFSVIFLLGTKGDDEGLRWRSRGNI